MAATAYASLVSLLNTIDQIHTHPLVSTFFDINQNKCLSEKVNFLVDFVEKYSDTESIEVEDLVRRIAEAAHKAEDIMEVHAADRIRGEKSLSCLPDLQKITEEMVSIKEEVIKVKEEIEKIPSFLSDLPQSSSSSSAAPPATDEATIMVGFDDYAHKLLDELLGHDVDRQIISITGMGGIGKTTLARYLFENSHTKCHFNVRAWITVSQECSARKVYLQALSCLGGGSIDRDSINDQQLSDELYKTLYNRRYVIVLDDVWSVEIWDKIKFYFPENRNGSRIIVTTRESKLVDYVGSSAHAVKFLDEENSWKLFCEKTFPQQVFPLELEEVGKEIVVKCGGLPLAITVVGGLLGKSPRTQEYWEKVAKDKSLILNLAENKPLDLLYLSYKYLPACLKPCFLYLGLYREDQPASVLELLLLWTAEGFIKPNTGQSLEEIGESYIKQLVDRNLLLIHSTTPMGKLCSIHDLLRDMCIKIGKNENFFYVQSSIDGHHHFIADQATTRFYSQDSNASDTPSIHQPLIVPVVGERAAPIKTRLLRVFYREKRGPYYPHQEVNMRLLHDYSSKLDEDDNLLPSMLPRFWSLQTIIIRAIIEEVTLVEFWKMPQLMYISITGLSLPDPPPIGDNDVCVLQKLQTLCTVHNQIFTEEVCERIPNIKRLSIRYGFRSQREARPCYHLENLGCLNKLEALEYKSNLSEHAGDSLHNIKFPSSLKKLILNGCKLEWGYMAAIASLSHLEYLKIERNAISTVEWVFVNEKFVSLKRLDISSCHYVTKWIAQSSNFPVLEELHIERMRQLDEIPSGIGEIPTLRSIFLYRSSESVNISAVKILHEQERFGNLGLRVEIYTTKSKLLWKKIQELDLTCQNLVIDY